MAKKTSYQGKHREFGNFAKTQGKHREFGFLKLSISIDSEGNKYFDICRENFQSFFKLVKPAKSVLCMYNSHKSRILAQGKCVVGQSGYPASNKVWSFI